MGIISRFKDIMAANINALLDKAEDPEKMIDQYLRNLESDLAKVKQETASVMAEELKTQHNIDVDKKKMVLNDAIKALGNYEVVCKLHKDVTAKLVVKVIEG